MAEQIELTINVRGLTEKDRIHETLEGTVKGNVVSSNSANKPNPVSKIDSKASDSSGASKSVAFATAAMTSFAVKEIKQFTNSTVAYIGSTYGDAATANHISNMMSLGSNVAGLATATIGGAMVGGPVGAAIGAVLGVATSALNIAQRAFNYTNEIQQKTNDARRMSERLGLISTDGNR